MAHVVIAQETGHQEDHEAEANDRVMFGFWVYLMTDLLMFAVLFAVYAVLHGKTLAESRAVSYLVCRWL